MFDPTGTDGTTAAGQASTFGYTIATAGTIITGTSSTAASFPITITSSVWAGSFTVALAADAVTDSAADTSAVPTTVNSAAFTMGYVTTATMVNVGGTSVTGTAQDPGTVYFRVSLSSGYIDGNNRFFWASGALATTDVSLDATKVTVTDALNNVYTMAQAGMSITTTAVSGVYPASSVTSGIGGWAQFPIAIANNRIGGVFTISLADGAVLNGVPATASFKSTAVSNIVTGFQVSYTNPMTVAYDIGVCSGGVASTCTGGTFTSSLAGAYATSATTLVMKITNSGGSFLASPVIVPARFKITGAATGTISSGFVVASTASAGSAATYYFAITTTTPVVDTYTIVAVPGAVTDSGSGAYYNSATQTITGLVMSWVPTFDLVLTGAEGVSVQSTVLTPASSVYLKVTYPSDVSALSPAATSIACDVSKLTVKDKANATVYGNLGGVFGMSILTTSGTVDAGTHTYALLPFTIAAPYGGAFSIAAADGACWTVTGTGRKSQAVATAVTTMKVQAVVVSQLVSIGAGGVEEVIADSTVSAGVATRAIGLRETVKLRIIKRGAPWRTAVTVNPSAGTQIRLVNGNAAATPPTLTLASCDHSVNSHYCDMPLVVLGKTVNSYTIAVDAGGLVDADSVTSAAAAASLAFNLRWSPRFGLTTTTYASAPVDKKDYAWAPSTAGLFLMVGLGDQDPTITAFAGLASAWTLDWSKVVIRNTAGSVVTAASVGLDLPTTTDTAALKSTAGDYLFFGSNGKFVNVLASPTVDTYTLDFDQGALYTTGSTQLSAKSSVALTASASYPFGLTGVRVGYPLTATLVRGDKTTSLSTTWIDRNDADVYLMLTPASGAISNFGTCASLAATSANFLFKFTPFGGSAVTQTVQVGSPAGTPYGCTEDNSGAAYFRLVLTGAGAAANTGFWSLDVASAAVVSNTNGKHRNYPQADVISRASKIMRVGFSVGYTVRDASGNDMSGTTRHLMPGSTYYLRVTRTSDDGGVFTAGNSPVIDASKMTVAIAGVTTTAITVGSTIRTPYDGSTYVEVPLTVSTAIAAGSYVFSADEGFLTYTATDNSDGSADERIKTGKWSSCLTQIVGIHFTADTVDVNGNSLEGRVLDTSVAANRVFYVRMWRTSGSFVTPALATITGNNCIAAAGSASSACLTWNYQLDASVDTTHITPTASLYRSTDTYVDFKVTLAANTPAGTYIADFGEGIITSSTFRTGKLTSAVSFSVAYALAIGTDASDVHNGAGTDLKSVWLGPASTAYLRIRLDTAAAAGLATAFTGATGSIAVDTSKIVFKTGGVAVTTFGFTGTNVFTAAGAVVDVGLDLATVAPGIYAVTLLAGAITDANGVTSQAQTGSVVNQATGTKGIKIGFGLALEYWKTDGNAPTFKVKSGEWVSGSTQASYALKISPNAAARSNNVRLSANTGTASGVFYIPTDLTATTLNNVGFFG